MKKILLRVDGSENSLRAVRHVIAMKGNFAGALPGSVTTKVIHLADMPVLLFK